MRLGVISDTHDRAPAIEKAVELFNASDLEAVLHCGDFVAPFAMLPFKNLAAPFYAVYGNNEGEKAGLEKLFDASGWTLNNRPWTFELRGKKIAMLHEPAPMEKFANAGIYDLIVFGHTHRPFVEKRGATLIVNPGEGCGWVTASPTVAIVDIDARDCQIIKLEL